VRETAADLARLQALLDDGRRHAGPHLRRAFGEVPTSAAEVVAALDGIFEMHLAVVTPGGAPRVAPIDGVLFHGQIWFGIPGAATRARLIRSEPRVSASYTKGDTAFIAHGEARELELGTPLATEYDELTTELYVAQYGPRWIEWRDHQRRTEQPGSGFTGWIEPRRLFAKA
jgi:hypothetical protein